MYVSLFRILIYDEDGVQINDRNMENGKMLITSSLVMSMKMSDKWTI